ncbi:Gfo/Idh/MocA family oxidoreductase [Luteitalea sp.]|uniref:Gfo/Idh/MocA family protein n=1 Tax=Luteitalea sp. TaxID=2004800 RepID=UPI0025BA6236|nr:Gfo/Idh/MocA family oxidoreductase [Luteitalea sp.]
MKPSTRRQFLGQTAGTVAGVTLAGAVLPTDAAQTARSASRVLGANDRIRLGFIGCGMQFQDLLRRGFFPRRDRQGDIDFVEVCDVWQPRVDNAKTKTGAERAGRDYRALLARPDIDGVVIVVPDHLHYTIARAAVLAGKDVYLEKPMTYTIDEAAKLQDVVQQTGRMLQVGGSGLNSPLHQALHQYVQAGKMGKVVWGFISYNRNTTEGMWDYPMPGIGSEAWPDAPVTSENLDWQAWLGGARKRPFSKERYFRWRKYWDYSGGNATDLLFHRLGALSAIVGFDFPTRVVSAGGIYVQKNRQVPDTYMTTVEYPKAYCFNMVSCMANADSAPITVYGNWGTLQVLPSVRQPGQPAPRGGGRGVITAERTFEKQFKEANDGKTQVEITTETPMEDLVDNWLNSMRSRQTPIYDVAKGYQVTVAIQLGVQSYKEGRALGYDPKSRRILTELPGRPEYPPQES